MGKEARRSRTSTAAMGKARVRIRRLRAPMSSRLRRRRASRKAGCWGSCWVRLLIAARVTSSTGIRSRVGMEPRPVDTMAASRSMLRTPSSRCMAGPGERAEAWAPVVLPR